MTENPGPLPPGLGDPVPKPDSPTEQPQSPTGEQNTGYDEDSDEGVDDDGGAVG